MPNLVARNEQSKLIATNAQLRQELENIKGEISARQYSNKRVGILSIHAGAGYNWASIAIDNHKRYAKKHGYAYYIENGKGALDDVNKVDSRPAVWSKLSALLRHMADDKHDWYWALDMDTLFMNTTIKAEDMLDDNYDLVVNNDCNMFNGTYIFNQSRIILHQKLKMEQEISTARYFHFLFSS
jgi:hypothetical protein